MKKPISVVTGANGFIGSHLVPHLLGQGHSVRCVVRKTSSLKWLEGLDVDYYKCGLTDVDALRQAFQGADYIFHLAGATKAKSYMEYQYGNVQLTRNVLDAADGIPTIQRVVLASSLAASAPARLNTPVDESTPSKPISLYGKSKLEAEQMVAADYAHLPYAIIRPPVVYGPRDTEVLLFFKTVARGLISKIGMGKKQVSLVYVEDLVQGMVRAATQKAATQQTYFITSDTQPEWADLGKEVSQILGNRAITLPIPHWVVHWVATVAGWISTFQDKAPTLNRQKAKEITQEAWTCSSAKAQRELGYQAEVSYPEGFKATLDWYRAEGWL